MIHYLNYQGVPNANGRLTTIVNNARIQWGHGQATWNRNNPGNQVDIVGFWREWNRDFFVWVVSHTQTFCRDLITEMKKYWAVRTGNTAYQVLETLRAMEAEVDILTINTAGFN